MSNLPDDFDHRAFDRAYGPSVLDQLDPEARTAAAAVYLASALGWDWSEADVCLDEALSGMSESDEQHAREALESEFMGQPERCIAELRDEIASIARQREQAAVRRAAQVTA